MPRISRVSITSGFIFSLLSVFACAEKTDAQNALDLFALGKVVYTTGAESCQTCHGADGLGTSRSSVSLREPQSWKAFQLESALRGSPQAIKSETVVKAVIALGAKGWNEKNFGELRSHLESSVQEQENSGKSLPFDEDMIGLDGPNKKALTMRVIRMMRKADMPRASSSEINDILAAAAFTYINEAFVEPAE